MASREFRDRLLRRAKKAAITVAPELCNSLEAYFRLLQLWNKKINLTGLQVDQPSDDAIDRLLIEPLAAARHVPATAMRLMDVGSGSGSPAVPIKLADPRRHVWMIESKTRKSAFLREVVRQLNLEHVSVETARFEELLSRPELHEAMDAVTMRAVRVEGRTLMTLQAFVRPGGIVMLFRTSAASDAPSALAPPLVFDSAHTLVESLRSRLVLLRKADLGYKPAALTNV